MPKPERAYCFTLNNWNEFERDTLKEVDCKYLTYGEEVSPSGTPHLQGYIYMRTVKSFIWMKRNVFPRANFRVARGTAKENYIYCSKGGVGVMEIGTRPISNKEKGLTQKRVWMKYYI